MGLLIFAYLFSILGCSVTSLVYLTSGKPLARWLFAWAFANHVGAFAFLWLVYELAHMLS